MLGATFRAKSPGVAATAAAAPGNHIHDGNNSRVVHFPVPISITTDCLLWTPFFQYNNLLSTVIHFALL